MAVISIVKLYINPYMFESIIIVIAGKCCLRFSYVDVTAVSEEWSVLPAAAMAVKIYNL